MISASAFYARTRPNERTGCWEWPVGEAKNPYGSVKTDGRIWRPSRLSWTLSHGKIPDGLCVLHQCDNPPCVNPSHLFTGTHTDNMRDKERKGRGNRPLEALHGMAKLTASEAQMIRFLRERGASQRKLAAAFKVSRNAVRLIEKGINWKNIPDLDVTQ